MSVPRRYLTLLSLWILSLMSIYCQDSITFSLDRAPCVGDTIEMICSIVPPPSETFGSSVAFVSINGSTAFSLTQLNSNSVLDGIDLSRYSANVNGLIPSTAMSVIRLIINSYLLTDSDTTFRCATTFLNGTMYDSTKFGSPMRQAVPPFPPVSLTADYNSPTCSGTVQLEWTPGASDRDIEMYFLSLNGVSLASLGPVTSYNHTTTLHRDTEYTYSIVAMSCAGNSTQTAAIPLGSYSLSDGSPFFLNYNQDTSNLFIDWSLVSTNTGLRDILIDYSLDSYYNHSQSDTTAQLYSNTSTFQQISTDTDYTVLLTPHSFNTDDGVVTNITVCLQITQQCGVAFSGVRICAFFNSENPPTTTPTTPTISNISSISTDAIATTPSVDILPIIIGSVAGVGVILLILVIILSLIMLYVCCIRNRDSRAPKEQVSQGDRVELATQSTPDTQPEATYAQVNKPSPSNRPSKKKAAPPPNLIYVELDMSTSTSARVNASTIPSTNYSDISQLPDHTTYADVN